MKLKFNESQLSLFDSVKTEGYGILDADSVGYKPRFPNLALMKISAYLKSQNKNVHLLKDYSEIRKYKQVFVGRVFTYTKVPDLSVYDNVCWGGSGFEKTEMLPQEIEHIKPDYDLYGEYVKSYIAVEGKKRSWVDEYMDFDIGYASRGCIRGCEFCINRHSKQSVLHSPVSEFIDKRHKYICLLDDNVLACKDWKKIIESLIEADKPFKFKSGFDMRLMTDEKAELLAKARYKDYKTFAFDDIKDYDLIDRKMKIWRKYNNAELKFYVLVGYYDLTEMDVVSAFERIVWLMKNRSLPYITRHERHENTELEGIYVNLARWCNQPTMFKSTSFREFCLEKDAIPSAIRHYTEFVKKYPEIEKKYFNIAWRDFNENKKTN